MNLFKIIAPLAWMFVVMNVFSQSESDNSITSEWETITYGKLQKKPIFKEPMISVRFIAEDGAQFIHLSLKYMFTDAVFEEAVPVEYYRNEKIEFATNKGKYELRAARYAKARRMNTIAQKTADIKIIFAGNLSFLKDDLVKSFTVQYAQGYQNIKLNEKEAIHLKEAYNKFLASLPKPELQKPVKQTPKAKADVRIEGEVAPAKTDTVSSSPDSLDKLRKNARKWRK